MHKGCIYKCFVLVSLNVALAAFKDTAPPAPLCAGAAVLYVLRLQGGRLYVGQTDALQNRLLVHRRRFGRELVSILAVRTDGTARARQLEAALQRELSLEVSVDHCQWPPRLN